MPPEPLPEFAAIRITATSTAIPRAIPSHAFQVQPPRRFIPLELSISNLLRSRTPLIPTFAIRTDAAPGSPAEGDESPILQRTLGNGAGGGASDRRSRSPGGVVPARFGGRRRLASRRRTSSMGYRRAASGTTAQGAAR